ncbi:MAG TPA: hypothetical protein EYN28_00320 [Flavobacteriales bacterium]|jgi:hypothetical protein|nr:hypothetical protein [Flavobacteriales bacterium]HHZ97720.1 hypothetical protein [Flavobacteriales bacterium]HIB77944.1 hypothetical protein [Flavobacteriales bacterium]HIN41651.1 hypothetical protein [Flavobacteriales bacterium]HIO15638.1 hypothetical protein [Flavobacteriales bacterium]
MKRKSRKALDCKLIGSSEITSGYFRYEVTIQESNGEVYKAPAFGRDMQDALSRLVWNERTEAVNRFANKQSWLQFVPLVSLLCVLGVFAFQAQSHDNPAWILGGLASVGAILGISAAWSQHLNKH